MSTARFAGVNAAMSAVAVCFLTNVAEATGVRNGPCQAEWVSTFGDRAEINGFVLALASFDDAFDAASGGGAALYAAGAFTSAGEVQANNIAKWDGSAWSPLGEGLNDSVYALAVFDDGTGPALYAGGQFTVAGEVGANYIARWNGSSWSPVGSGMDDRVRALTVFDDGTGPALYAGGHFRTAGGVTAHRIAKWDGRSWSPLGNGMSITNEVVLALTVFDDGAGDGTHLYAGGGFTMAGESLANNIAKWDGSSWSALTTGIDFGTVFALAVFGDDSGAESSLYVGGNFVTAGGVSANRIAKWDGSNWSALGSGLNHFVYSLTSFNDGSGPSLFAGGLFTTAGGISVNRIARWDGKSWSALEAGMSGGSSPHVAALAVFDDLRDGPALYAGGHFEDSPAGDSNLAQWGCTVPQCTPADIVSSGTFQPPPDGQVDAADLAFLLGEWGPNPGSPADFVSSGTFMPPPDRTVDAADLAVLLGAWGPCP